MAFRNPCLKLLVLLSALVLCALSGSSSQSKLHKLLTKREAVAGTKPVSEVSLQRAKAEEFLSSQRRLKRNVWDRSRPDVQQWIIQFMYMGYDEARLEADLSYWMDHSRTNDQGRQHHYDENAPIGPQDPSSYRHGANVNYDYY
ncbi:augurin-B [Chanos chanos]|uniref:Augurin-B n=1 Tax=Chanos chanos TaxID=29144 RepID=A0A6J2W4K0_CHACN|nr:augurin-B-like [Chanos chanos]